MPTCVSNRLTSMRKPRTSKSSKSPVGMPGRAISGEFLREVEQGHTRPKACRFHCIKTCDPAKTPYCIITALFNAFRGNLKKGYAFAGSNAYRETRISSVREVIGELVDGLSKKHLKNEKRNIIHKNKNTTRNMLERFLKQTTFSSQEDFMKNFRWKYRKTSTSIRCGGRLG